MNWSLTTETGGEKILMERKHSIEESLYLEKIKLFWKHALSEHGFQNRMKIINTTVTLESSKLHLIHLMGERGRERTENSHSG